MSRYCPLCEKESDAFKPFGYIPREDALCPECGSLERHRLSWLVMKKKLEKSNTTHKTMLHIAPEKVFQKIFSTYFGDNYLTADLHAKNVKIKMDITSIELDEETFDFIYCSHVLEHIPDDRKAMRELHRVLKKEGWAILLVPVIAKGKTEEHWPKDTKEERMKYYGHPDHVRNYGTDYKTRLEESGWDVEVVNAEDFLAHDAIERMGITKAAGEIYFCTKAAKR